MALCSKEPSADLVASSFSLELPQKHLEDCTSIFKRISVNKKKKLMCPTGTGADQNRNLEPLLGLLGISWVLFLESLRFFWATVYTWTHQGAFLWLQKGSRSNINTPGLHLGFTQTGSWFLLTSCKPFIIMLMTLVEDACRRNGGRKFSRGRRKDTGKVYVSGLGRYTKSAA